MTKKVADLLVDVLAGAGVRRIYGVVGDSLNGITDSIRVKNNLEWVHVRHEEAGALAAGAEAHLTGTLAVCAGSCGPGNMHLINGRPQWHRPALSYPSHAPRAVSQSGCVAYRLDYGKEWRCHPYSIRRMVILSTVR